jgi:hypothetical protein
MYTKALVLAENMKPGEARQNIIMTASQARERLIRTLLSSLRSMNYAADGEFIAIPKRSGADIYPRPDGNVRPQGLLHGLLLVEDIESGFLRVHSRDTGVSDRAQFVSVRDIVDVFLLPDDRILRLSPAFGLGSLDRKPVHIVHQYTGEEMLSATSAFAQAFPEFAREVEDLLEARYFKRAQESGQAAHYEEYRVRYPTGRFAANAKADLERKRFDQAVAAGTIVAVESFLREYPESTRASDARTRIEYLEFQAAVDNAQ